MFENWEYKENDLYKELLMIVNFYKLHHPEFDSNGTIQSFEEMFKYEETYR